MSPETIRTPYIPDTYEDVLVILYNLAGADETHVHGAEGVVEIELSWDTTVRKLVLTPAIANEVALGDTVRCHFIGDDESGITLILRPRNIFDKRRYGFHIQPAVNTPSNPSGYEVWQGLIRQQNHNKTGHRTEFLDERFVQLSDPEVARELIHSLSQNVDFSKWIYPEA
jgi:hypothetical protein